MSRPGEKFLIEPSRKFLLTAARLKDGTNRDEPRRTRLAGLVETSQRRQHDAAGSGGEDGSDGPMGADPAPATGQARRRGCGARVAGTAVQPQACQEAARASAGDIETTGMA